MSEQDKGYNGWTNYETWAVALWIDNEPGTYQERIDLAAQAKGRAPREEAVKNGIWTLERAPVYVLADMLKGWVSDELLPDLGATLAADLMGAALSEVDWQEIAENFLAE